MAVRLLQSLSVAERGFFQVGSLQRNLSGRRYRVPQKFHSLHDVINYNPINVMSQFSKPQGMKTE